MITLAAYNVLVENINQKGVKEHANAFSKNFIKKKNHTKSINFKLSAFNSFKLL
jgi:hypothetical protein